jgi:hypothetical protein
MILLIKILHIMIFLRGITTKEECKEEKDVEKVSYTSRMVASSLEHL